MPPWFRKIHISRSVVRYLKPLPPGDQEAFLEMLHKLDRDPFAGSSPIAQRGAMHLRVARFARHRVVLHFNPWVEPLGELRLLEAEPEPPPTR